MVEIAYTPLNPVVPKDIQAPTKIDTPDYPDKGTIYAGYSKTLYSGNTYQLNPQNQDDITGSITFVGGETQNTISLPFGNLKDYYITKIYLGLYHSGGIMVGGQRVYISNGEEIKIALMEDVTATTESFNLDFLTPIKIDKGNLIYLNYSQARTATDVLTITLNGWAE